MRSGIVFLTVCFLSACSVLQQKDEQAFSEGYYRQKRKREANVYVQLKNDNIVVYPVSERGKAVVDSTLDNPSITVLPLKTDGIPEKKMSFSRQSFDLDLLTIPFKFRPSRKDVPTQLNSALNGALYAGYRVDHYAVSYKENPLAWGNREVNHFGISFGLFSGIGSTFMSPTNTQNVLQQEYDGVVWSKGLAGIVGLNNFTFGAGLGIDNLFDENSHIWIYEGKIWFGLVFGLNIN